MTTVLRRAAWCGLLVALWEAASRLGPWPPWILPGPSQVAISLYELAREGSLAGNVARSIGRLGAGYGLALLIGVPLGLLIGRSRLAEEVVGTPVLGLQSLPSICWLPVAMLWFGLSEGAILFVVVMGSALSVALASQAGVRSLNPLWIRAARTLGARGVGLYTSVLLPASLPSLLSGAKLGWTFAWRSLMAAELLYVSGGLGQLLHAGRELNDVARVFAVMTLILAIGLATEKLAFAPLERRIHARFGMDRE
ncbi:MAG: ABC transporter permease [Myxococcales bacterium]|nr:ABC transporter permease [Myxococcales bacterium]